MLTWFAAGSGALAQMPGNAMPFRDAGANSPFIHSSHPMEAGGHAGHGHAGQAGHGQAGMLPTHMPPTHTPVNMGQGGMPPGTLPWPQVSPYEHRFEQHYNENGLWNRRVDDSPRKYWFHLGGSLSKLRRPDTAPIGDEVLAVRLGTPNTNTALISKNIKAPGFRTEWGFMDPTESGFVGDAWWVTDRGRAADAFAVTGGAGFPMTWDDGRGGSTITIDEGLVYDLNAEAAGSAAHWLMAPKWRKGGMNIRPIAGIRYLYIKEAFSVLGSSTTNGSFFIDSRSRSQLAGPDIGMRFDLGGESFRVIGQSTVGLMANYQELAVRDTQMGVFATDSLSTSSISPVFEQRIHVEAKVFSMIPMFRKIPALERATFRIGFTTLMAAEVSRAPYSIAYRISPLNSKVRIDRQKWATYGWDFGINWRY
jgi:hypothetical protein